MAHLSLYRKYRSQSFGELSGQDHVTRTLQNAIRSGRVAHAYLFCGPRGTGKTSTARLLAKALNCEQGPLPEPCNVCDACRQISEGRFLDVLEMDAASNRGIDHIRDLRDAVAYAPAVGRTKVYVVDEAHQITNEGFNALLKTLEEPPPYVVFILATTDAQKVPATILSRCQRFEFRRASTELLCARMGWVAEQEGASLEAGTLELLAREANGSWRDALSLLEQVLAFSEGTVRVRDVYTVLGTVEADTLYALAESVLAQDGGTVFRHLDTWIAEGKDPRQLLRDVMGYFRDLLLAAAGSPPPTDPQIAGRRNEQAGKFGSRRLLAALEALAQADREARWSEQPRWVLEFALVRLLTPRDVPSSQSTADDTVAQTPATQPRPASAASPRYPQREGISLPSRDVAARAPAAGPNNQSAPEPGPFPSAGAGDEPRASVPAARLVGAAAPDAPPIAAEHYGEPPLAATNAPAPAAGPRVSGGAGPGLSGEGGSTWLPEPPLTLGDARIGGRDEDDENLAALFPAEPAPQAAVATPLSSHRTTAGAPPQRERPAAGQRSGPPRRPEPAAVSPPGTDGRESTGVGNTASGPLGAEQLTLVQQKWRIVQEELKRRRKMGEHVILADTRPDRFEGSELVVLFPSGTMAEAFANRPRESIQSVVEALHHVTGVQCRLRAEGPGGARAGTGGSGKRGPGGPGRGPGGAERSSGTADRSANSAPAAPHPAVGDAAAGRPAPDRGRDREGRGAGEMDRQRASQDAAPERAAAGAPARGTGTTQRGAAHAVPAATEVAQPAMRAAPPRPAGNGNPELVHDVVELFDGQILQEHETL